MIDESFACSDGSGRTPASGLDRPRIRIPHRQIGSLDLLDFALIGRHNGRDLLPFPFAYTEPSRFEWEAEARAYALGIPERFRAGDLSVFRHSMAALANLDILVSCHAQSVHAQPPRVSLQTVTFPRGPSTRIVAFRTGQDGFLMAQRPDADVIDVFAMTAYDLGAAVAQSLPLIGPGSHQAVFVPEFARRRKKSTGSGVVVRDTKVSRSEVKVVRAAAVSTFGVVRSHTRLPARWMPATGERRMAWLQVEDDGDYGYPPNRRYARPMTEDTTRDRINRLIAEDVAQLRELRDV